jgi:mono/diheme cytochrome c family protein
VRAGAEAGVRVTGWSDAAKESCGRDRFFPRTPPGADRVGFPGIVGGINSDPSNLRPGLGSAGGLSDRRPWRAWYRAGLGFLLLWAGLGTGGFRGRAVEAEAAAATMVDFQREVRPVLAAHCFPCHGPDAGRRKGNLRLDTREGAVADLGGRAAVVPGDTARSVLVSRLRSTDPEERMPPPESHRRPSPAEMELLERWVRAGAGYDRHWAFRPAVRALPAGSKRHPDWARRPVDRFVLARLEAEGLEPSPEAGPATWLRRASLDLVGLPPTPAESVAFAERVASAGEGAYAEAVDRLLASPRYGERQAQEWLDVARFADTHGFNNDTTRTMWRWRDWVIDAFNDGMRYDRFLTEQLAGDLLPNPTLEQRIATGFGRNHVVNSEGGIIDEEYRVEYVADRVRTLGMAWLGMTLECSRCHDHKYDPITQRDYYRLFAFFNQIDEVGEDGRIGNAAPLVVAPTRVQQERLAVLEAAIAEESAALAALGTNRRPERAEVAATLRRRAEVPWVPAPADPLFAASTESRPAGAADRFFDAVLEPGGRTNLVLPVKPAQFSAAQAWTFATWVRWEGGAGPLLSTMDYLTDPSAGGYGRGAEVRLTGDGAVEVRVAEFWPAYALRLESGERLRPGVWRHVAVSYDGGTKAAGVRIHLDGRETDVVLHRDGLTGKSGAAHGPLVGSTSAREPEVFRGQLGALRLYGRVLEPEALAAWVEDRALRCLASGDVAHAVSEDLSESLGWRVVDGDYAGHWAARERWRAERRGLLREAPQTMVMAERSGEPRATYVLRRGHYAARGEVVEAGVPEAFGVPWPEGAPRNRLGLARWLTHSEHPLTARVVVNRVWAQLFGTGLVKTVEDFGIQGEHPSHPELLDWLAREFVDSGWDFKGLLREVVLSATYRQDSAVTAELRERDPANRLWARGPRVRLPAEVIRDQALDLAGLLRHRLGGPSVFPPQPETLYQGVVVAADYPGTRWAPSAGEDRYRRSLYTFWKRTVPHPVMTTFDAPDREFCTARRLPTNTPLQALALLNEPTFVEAAAGLGRRVRRDAGPGDAERLNFLFRLATGRTPEPGESEALRRTLSRLRAQAGVAAEAGGAGAEPDEAGIWAELGSLALNLDETITKD